MQKRIEDLEMQGKNPVAAAIEEVWAPQFVGTEESKEHTYLDFVAQTKEIFESGSDEAQIKSDLADKLDQFLLTKTDQERATMVK